MFAKLFETVSNPLKLLIRYETNYFHTCPCGNRLPQL